MKKALLSIIAIIMGGFLVATPLIASAPAYAEECKEGCVKTSILGDGGCVCDDGNGSSIKGILDTVVNFLSIGIGILGVIGVTVVGIQYLTAGGNEEQTRKAKRRLLEIVIGLAAYFLMYGILEWLGILK